MDAFSPAERFELPISLGIDGDGKAVILEDGATPAAATIYAELTGASGRNTGGWTIAAVYLGSQYTSAGAVKIPSGTWPAEKAERLLLGEEGFHRWADRAWSQHLTVLGEIYQSDK